MIAWPFESISPAEFIRYFLSALLVACLAVAYFKVRVRAWKVFFVTALIAVFAYGVLTHRMAGDHPGYLMGFLLYFMMIGGFGVILGFAIMVWRARRRP